MTSHVMDALRGRLPDLYFVNASSAQMEHHSALLARLSQEKRIIEFLCPPGTFLTDLTLCAYHDARPGLLAKICGTLAALKVKVHTASVFTVQQDNTIILDTLQISESYLGHDRRLSANKQKEIRIALEQLLEGQIANELTSKVPLLRRSLKVHEVQSEVTPRSNQRIIRIRTTKNQLAVFRMAAAMASLGLDIQAAQIHLSNNDVQGIFFVTGQYEGDLEYQLRFELQSSSFATDFA